MARQLVVFALSRGLADKCLVVFALSRGLADKCLIQCKLSHRLMSCSQRLAHP